MNISRCPSCLKPSDNEFCLSCRKKLFKGKAVSYILPFTRPEYNQRKREGVGRLSISGVQSKYSLKLNGNRLEMTEAGGEYILKPYVQGELEDMHDMPANEHVTMQIARQVFDLDAAGSALLYFADGETPAYLTKRFDLLDDGTKQSQEDFAQIAQMSGESDGDNFKYKSSYQKIAQLMEKHVSTYAFQIPKLFRLIIFNYLTQNGDAHLKNFSLYRDTVLESYLLTPAYDLLNTRLHIPADTAMALDLFEGDFQTESYKVNVFYAYDDFMEFGKKIKIPQGSLLNIIEEFYSGEDQVYEMLENSFLSDANKQQYKDLFKDRIKALKFSYNQKSL